MEFFLFGIVGYLLGSVPTAVWVGKTYYKVDIREQGSKNAGATNTFRVLGKKAGIIVLAVDIVKGAFAVLAPFLLGIADWGTDFLIHLQLVAGTSAVLGHIFPLFARFKGGKGVATSLGIITGIHPLAALTCLTIFLIVFIISSYVSLGAIVAAVSFPLVVIFMFGNQNNSLTVFSILLSVAVILAHRKNIKRILNGNENKMNLFKK
ncbi:MAG: glycerol-3-phosphate 1-O-acyltransferase PlsY [Brumimicrobium sp.]|nr:glycerol-3-phosphate 1-O-acyltransferase PlsY [Brumimicrobium sp.]